MKGLKNIIINGGSVNPPINSIPRVEIIKGNKQMPSDWDYIKANTALGNADPKIVETIQNFNNQIKKNHQELTSVRLQQEDLSIKDKTRVGLARKVDKLQKSNQSYKESIEELSSPGTSQGLGITYGVGVVTGITVGLILNEIIEEQNKKVMGSLQKEVEAIKKELEDVKVKAEKEIEVVKKELEDVKVEAEKEKKKNDKTWFSRK